MECLIAITNNAINARDLYKALFINHDAKEDFRHWIGRRIKEYKFINGEDFREYFSESNNGRPSKEYAISLDMAKELCMVEKTDIAKKIRKYFIECEKTLRNLESKRYANIEIRKTMTEAIKESVQNENMHGFAYSNYTKLVYKKAGIEYIKDKNFRDKLNEKELKLITELESIIKSYIELGYNYLQIKNMLPEIIVNTENKKLNIGDKNGII